jgi:hypothetical protein
VNARRGFYLLAWIEPEIFEKIEVGFIQVSASGL